MNRIFYYRDNDMVRVTVDDVTVPLSPSLRVWAQSPAGFEIGYAGSGPAQLALAILMLFTDDKTASKLHQTFKFEFLADSKYRDADIGTINVDVPAWIEGKVTK
jgi:hypothetical protein